jgi:hypothetical protein
MRWSECLPDFKESTTSRMRDVGSNSGRPIFAGLVDPTTATHSNKLSCTPIGL